MSNKQPSTSSRPRPSGQPRRNRRLLRRLSLVLILVIVGLGLTVQYGLGLIIRKGAQAAGPALLGTEIQLARVHARPFFGIIECSGLRIGPPEPFKADVFVMDDFKILLEPGSVFSDTLVIREIAIIGPEITYELSGLRSNIGAIMDRVQRAEKAAKEKDEAPGKKVVIEQFVFSGGRIRIASTLTGGRGIVIPMPTIELTDIGKKSGGITGVEALAQVFSSIGTGILRAVRDAGFSIGNTALEGLGAIGGAVADGARAIGGTAADGTKAISGAVVDSAGAVGGAAIGGVRAVGGAATDGVRAVGGAVEGLLGRSRQTNAPPSTTNTVESEIP